MEFVQRTFDCIAILATPGKFSELDERFDGVLKLVPELPIYLLVTEDSPAYSTPLLKVLSLGANFSSLTSHEQFHLVTTRLAGAGLEKPLIWTDETCLGLLLQKMARSFRVFHPAEDYFSPTCRPLPETERSALRNTLRNVDLVVVRTADMLVNLRQSSDYQGESVVMSQFKPPAIALGGLLTANLTVSYDSAPVLESVQRAMTAAWKEPKNILILYDPFATYTATVAEYLDAFRQYSVNNIVYVAATQEAECTFDLNLFDVVVLHYSIRLCFDGHLSSDFAHKLIAFQGPKLQFIQDEYDKTSYAKRNIHKLGITTVFTCVPDEYIQIVYPPSELPGVTFRQVLTGYVPENYAGIYSAPTETRPILIGYRGRPLPYWYGELGQEKMDIGKKMRAACEARGLAVDIDWTEESRIYGPKWYEFIRSCRAMLGTESGANVFDDQGDIRANIEAAIKLNPSLTFEEASRQFIGAEREGKVKMNQISPKMFETIAFKTALILYEGQYSGILRPNVHYIELKKDFSNIDDVLRKLHDNEFIHALTERAFQDVIASGKYGYRSFINQFDEEILRLGLKPLKPQLISSFVGVVDERKEISFSVLVGTRKPKYVKSYRYAQSALNLPSPLFFNGMEFQDKVPERETSYEFTMSEFRHIARLAPTKVLIRAIAVRAWLLIPRPVRAVLKIVLWPVKKMIT